LKRSRKLKQSVPIDSNTCHDNRRGHAQADSANVHVGGDTGLGDGHARIEKLKAFKIGDVLVLKILAA